MPRKRRRAAKARATVPLTPAWTYELLAGSDPRCRLRGWVTCAQAGQYGEPTAADVWAAHRGALLAEAAAYGFAPFAYTHTPPTGAGFAQWVAAFLSQHRY